MALLFTNLMILKCGFSKCSSDEIVHHGSVFESGSNKELVQSKCAWNMSTSPYSCNSSFQSDESSLTGSSMVKCGINPVASHELPYDTILHFSLEPTGWLNCMSLVASELHGYEGLEVLRVERKLVGNGSHRELSTSVIIRQEKSGTCNMVTVEKLPIGVFADMFELDGLVAHKVFIDAQVYGDRNLELPALHSSQSIVVLHTIINITDTHSDQAHSMMQAKVSLPLHARYPRLSLESHVLVNFSLPYVLFHCLLSDNTSPANIAWTLLSWSDNMSLQWAVPAGNPMHTRFVAVTTACTALIGVAVLLVVSSCSLSVEKNKSV